MYGKMYIRFEMWNEKVENEVAKYVSKIVGHQVNDHQVQIIPFDKVILTSTIPSTAFYMTTHWLPYQLQKLRISFPFFEILVARKNRKRHSLKTGNGEP
jgi:hypothetical protein